MDNQKKNNNTGTKKPEHKQKKVKHECNCNQKCECKHDSKPNTKELDKLKKENELLNEKLLRISAEMQNIKRRNDEEKSKLIMYDGEDLVKKLLPIIDNFERAVKLDDDNLADDLSKFLEGFKMIYGNLVNILKEKNIKEIDCVGEQFDPTKMEAVLTDHIEGKDAGIVIDCLQKGYTYNDKVIRVAMVKVSE